MPDLRRRLVAFGEWRSREAEADVFFDHGDKLRLEVSAALGGGQLEVILGHLGVVRLQQFVKLRETYRLGTTIVRLDQLESVGWFYEITALAGDLSLDTVAAAMPLDPTHRASTIAS